MIEIPRILCPVDLSDCSRHALEHAVVIARWYDSTITVLHVESVSPPVQDSREQILVDLKGFTQQVDISGVPLDFELLPGGPVQGILEAATSLVANLIVMGTHGRGGLDRFVLGSVAEKILRKASCPVLTVPPPVSRPPAEAQLLFKRILCALDFSDSSMKGLTYALALADEADARLYVMHVLEGFRTQEMTAYPDFNLSEYIQHMEHDALVRLQKAVPEEARTWCEPVELLGSGKTYREILREAQERDVHLIVMGVHGRDPVDLMLFGSTTHHVIRAAPCPVLTVRG